MDQAAREAPGPVAAVATWAEAAIARLGSLPDVRRVGLALVEGGGRRLRFTASDRDPAADVAWCHVDGYDDVPLNTAIRTGNAVFGAVDALAERYAEFAARQSPEHVALAAVPLAEDEVLGGYVLYFERPQAFDARQRDDLVRLGCELAAGLRRAMRRLQRPPGAGLPAAEGALVAIHEVDGTHASVRTARRFLGHTLTGWELDEDVIDDATVCLSELVTNAVIHAQGGCVVRAELREGVLTVSVRDAGLSGAARAEPVGDPLQVHGRGLQVVEALASRWGYDVDADGARVWFALAVPVRAGRVSGTPPPR